MNAERLPRPPPENLEPSMWVDEAIWGHRLHDEQTPWLAFLEFLNVLRAEADAGRPFQEPTSPDGLQYSSRHLLYLRNLVFNNPGLSAILRNYPDDRTRWSKWREAMADSADGLAKPSFEYLEKRFSSFEDFALLVQLLRSTSLEGNSNKRWTSKFLFPYGPDCLYEDVRLDEAGNASNDRRFFARVGELAYLMLCRSGRGGELFQHLKPLLLDRERPWNRLPALLEPTPSQDRVRSPTTPPYLPYKSAREYDDLAADWLALLKANLPGYDVLPHLVNLLGLHLLLYFLRRAASWAGSGEVRLVLEILAPRRTTVRDVATATFIENDLLSTKAVQNFIETNVANTPQWRAASSSDDPFDEAKRVIRNAVAWKALRTEDGYSGPPTPEGLLSSLHAAAVKRHRQHVSGFHAEYAKAIGLASRRGARRLRYTPSDQLLKSIVITTVHRRYEFQEFLEILNERYGLVIGHRQAASYIGAMADQRAFEQNAKRLEMRLSSLGLLKRLSDSCAYVENPFGGCR
jgi:hypothetical protein